MTDHYGCLVDVDTVVVVVVVVSRLRRVRGNMSS